MSERTGVRIAVAGAFVTIAGALSFAVAYLAGANLYATGVCASAAFAGIAVSFWAWATAVVEPARVVEERDVTPSASAEELELGREFASEAAGLTRPELFTALSLAAGAALGVAALVPLRSLAVRPATAGPPKAAPWRPGVRVVDMDGKPVRRGTLDIGAIATVFPEGAMDDPTASVVLIRLDPHVVLAGARRDWAVEGYIAFSKICTHVGCPVALYRKSVHELLCPCHQSRFDVLDGARPIAGPASRALPQLALVFDASGILRARQGFVEPVGPAAWGQT